MMVEVMMMVVIMMHCCVVGAGDGSGAATHCCLQVPQTVPFAHQDQASLPPPGWPLQETQPAAGQAELP